MSKNASRFSALLAAVTDEIKSRDYLFSGIYPDKMVEIGADMAAGIGRLSRQVELAVAGIIQALSFDAQAFIWSECFAIRSEKDDLLNALAEHIAEGQKYKLFADENITATLCHAFTEAVLEQARIAYNDYKRGITSVKLF